MNNANGYVEENDGNKYLTLVSADEGKEKLKKYEEMQSKIKSY